MKRSPCIFPFWLVKENKNEGSAFSSFPTLKTRKDCRALVVLNSLKAVKCRLPSICLHLFRAGINYLRKRYSLTDMVKRFSQVLFSTFLGSRDTNVRKGTMWSFLLHYFSNSLNMKKIPSYTFVELVKLLNNIGFVIMTNTSFSFLGLVKLTRLDSFKGWTYSARIWHPLQACD